MGGEGCVEGRGVECVSSYYLLSQQVAECTQPGN